MKSFSGIIAESQKMLDVFDVIKRLSKFSTTVLITGESGTGKELVARAIHDNSSRRSKPFIAINCGAIPEHLMESELFGHRKGAFTDASRDKKGLFEEANGGTLFLDEIGELPPQMQVKLLRALQEQQIRRVGDEQPLSINVRIIAATLRNLETDIKNGRFRDDLFYRLNVVSIHIPALKERKEDIPALAAYFVEKQCGRFGIEVKEFSDTAMQCLLAYHWRGNVRELENCVERAVVLSEGTSIKIEALPDHIKKATPTDYRMPVGVDEDNLSIKERTKQLEIGLIMKALRKTKGNRTRAAKVLEISHRALLYKLKEYNLGHL